MDLPQWVRPEPPAPPQKYVVVTIIQPIYQSQLCQTIHYTWNKRLEGLSWYEMARSVRTHTILVWNLGYLSHNRHHPPLKSRSVVMVMNDELKSQPYITIHYTYNEALEGVGCCELPKSVQTYSILVWKVGKGQANFDPTRTSKTCCGDHYRAHIPTSTFPNHSSYL